MIGVGGQEHGVSTIGAGGLHLPVYQDPQELKKKRNRLAQRKHRDRLKANTSADSGQNNAPEETSAQYRTSSIPEKTLTQPQSEATMNQNLYTTYQSGEMVSAMDFSLPGSPENGSDSGQFPDLEQHMMPMSEASFDNHGSAFLPENLGMRQDFMAQAYRGYQSQNDSSLVYEMPQQQLSQSQPHAARASHTTRPLVQTQHSFPSVMSTSNATQMSHNSFVPPKPDGSTSGENQDHINSSSSSKSDNGSSSAQSGLPETPESIPDTGDLEARFETVIKAVEEAGFESIDDLSTQYYTANFKEDTVSHWAQSRSRSRSLHAFLASLHASTNNWSDREVQGYRQQITEAAESLYVSELSYARKDIMQNRDTRSQTQGEKASSPVTQSAMSVQNLWQTIAEMELSQDFKQKKTMMREKMPETWSLLVELTRKADLRQPRGSQAVCAFLLLLLESNPDPSPRVTRGVNGRNRRRSSGKAVA